jgi:hypothetical protein
MSTTTPTTAPVTQWLDDVLDHEYNQVLIDHSYVDAAGYASVPNAQEAIINVVLGLPLSNSSRISPDGTIGTIMLKVFPNLKTTNFTGLEEMVFHKVYDLVNRTCGVGVQGKVQRALVEEGAGRILCKGKIVVKSGDKADGVWITTNPKLGGPMDAQFNKIVKGWSNKIKGVVAWGDMAVGQQKAFAKTAIAALESNQKETAAAIASFKLRALAMAAEPNGSASEEGAPETPEADVASQVDEADDSDS